MNAIRAVVRNGRIETDQPLNLPEGTELEIPLPDTATNGMEIPDGPKKRSPVVSERRPQHTTQRAMGKYAHVPGSSDEFARRKEHEIVREDRSRQ